MYIKIKISSLSNPLLEPYRTLRRPELHIKENIFVAEGKKLVERLLLSDFKIKSILITEDLFEDFEDKINKRKEEFTVFIGSKNLLSEIVGFQLHQGIMTVAFIPEKVDLHNFIESTKPTFLVAVDGIMNSENLGVIVRSCAAFNVDALIVGETSSDPFLRRAVRNSMGNIFKLPIIYSQNLANDILFLQAKHKIKCFAAHTSPKSKSIYKINFKQRSCIVFGNEESGPREEVLKLCELFMIPMEKNVDSLNVASAAAVALYEAAKERSSFNFK